ncbi:MULTISPECIES: LysE family translocator [unclassified Roseitalea]|uniref:LysE family translocator n=1 Tax=unclassified Roseitalea TaxID=2639107 RepID=UPI00273E595F|nr:MULTISPECIES: LysE family translocator [unclassified Roseitalea]
MSEFIPGVSVLVQFALASAILAITPGPDMALYVGRAITHSRAVGLACFAGAVTGVLIHTVLVALGLSALLVAAPTAFMVLKIVGALYLVYLAWQAIRHGSSFTVRESSRGKAGSLWGHYLTGIGINILNPKVALFFLTFLPQFVSPDDPNAPGKLIFLGLFFLFVAVPIILPMILAADLFAGALKARPRITRLLDWMFAGVFGAFAVKILTAQAR